MAVVYADDNLVVVDKPAGLVVHPGAGNRHGTLVQQLMRVFPDIARPAPTTRRPGIVQRLDKGTSGLMVVARSTGAREGLVEPARCPRPWSGATWLLSMASSKRTRAWWRRLWALPRDRVKMAVVEGGRHARTHYRAQARSPSPLPVTLVTVPAGDRPRPTRCALTSRPSVTRSLVDQRYAKAASSRRPAEALPALRRPWLHAASLGFVHPVTGET